MGFLKENNPLCVTCQWLQYQNNTCSCGGNENMDMDISDLHHTKCDDYYNEDMILNPKVLEDEGLFSE